jgi:hypothetical protein
MIKQQVVGSDFSTVRLPCSVRLFCCRKGRLKRCRPQVYALLLQEMPHVYVGCFAPTSHYRDLTLNWIILAVLLVIAAILGVIVVKRRMREQDDDYDI